MFRQISIAILIWSLFVGSALADSARYSSVKIKKVRVWDSGKAYLVLEHPSDLNPAGCRNPTFWQLSDENEKAKEMMLSLAMFAMKNKYYVRVAVDTSDCARQGLRRPIQQIIIA